MVNKQFSNGNRLAKETRQERRERRRAKQKAKIPQHGKSLARIYRDAISKRARNAKAPK